MEPQWRPLRDPVANRVWQQVLRPVAAELRTGADKVAELIVQLYQAEAPQVVPDAAAVAEQIASTEAALHQIAQWVASRRTTRPRSSDTPRDLTSWDA
jgi:hypothetical protein